ncbi:MAG: AcrR family transcriptional regulator [Candidatus Azotimanducaceae bacterium]|jgi:AcrR family transcriptional regulator
MKKGSRQRLRQAARELFVEVGYHDTRPQDIARRAGVANGTFYLHFADKQKAFLDFSRQAQDELLKVMDERVNAAQGRRERWRTICGAVIDFDVSEPGLLQAAFLDPVVIAPNDVEAWQMYDRLGHLLSLALAEDSGTTNTNSSNDSAMDSSLISHGICGMLRHAMIYASRNGLDREKLMDDLSRFIDQGLAPAAGVEKEPAAGVEKEPAAGVEKEPAAGG